jgi:hypothetical protein
MAQHPRLGQVRQDKVVGRREPELHLALNAHLGLQLAEYRVCGLAFRCSSVGPDGAVVMAAPGARPAR